MEDKVFVLAYSWYEEYNPYYFIGSDLNSEEAFSKLCDSLIDQAVQNAITTELSNPDGGSWVGWHDIVRALIPLLEIQGYKHFEPKIKVLWGSGIVDSERDAKGLSKESAEALIKYNLEKKEEMYKDH